MGTKSKSKSKSKSKPKSKSKQHKGKKQQSTGEYSKQATRNWVELPPDVTANILHRLGAIDILENAQKVCTTWRKICQDPSMWRIIDMQNLGDLHNMPYDLEKMCMHAVDRSQGQLLDINIQYFGTENLIDYIVQRSSQLRRLQIACCYGSFYDCLSEAVKKLPLLEELSFTFTEISTEAIESAGRFCTLLKSLKVNTKFHKFTDIETPSSDSDEFRWDRDDEAVAIAKHMPQLRELQLIGNQMTNKGLLAILDGCTHLESLDLRRCMNLNFEGSLAKRCSEQIEILRRPNESTKGCEFRFEDAANGYEYDDDKNEDEDEDDDDYDYCEEDDYDDFTADGYISSLLAATSFTMKSDDEGLFYFDFE